MLVTPWFAAASFFVIAASLWIYSPHAQLQFPKNNAIGLQHCHSRCLPAASNQGSLASSAKDRLTDPRKSGARRAGNRAGVSGLTFSYYVLQAKNGTFTIRISVTSKRAINDWTLAVTLPGDRIGWVAGANWQRTSRDSGTASGAGGRAGHWPGNGQGGYGQPSGNHWQYGFAFLVSGTGPPVAPTSCRYDGQACAFRTG